MSAVLEKIDVRNLRTLLVALSFSVVVVSFSYLIWPEIKAFKEKSESVNLMMSLSNSPKSIESELVQREKDVDQLNKTLHGDMANMPLQQLESYIIGQLQSVSWATDMKLLGVRPNKGMSYSMFQEILFDVQLLGRYHDFFAWLEKVSADFGFIAVKKYQINPSNEKTEDPKLNIKLTMVAYRAES